MPWIEMEWWEILIAFASLAVVIILGTGDIIEEREEFIDEIARKIKE